MACAGVLGRLVGLRAAPAGPEQPATRHATSTTRDRPVTAGQSPRIEIGADTSDRQHRSVTPDIGDEPTVIVRARLTRLLAESVHFPTVSEIENLPTLSEIAIASSEPLSAVIIDWGEPPSVPPQGLPSEPVAVPETCVYAGNLTINADGLELTG